jgi:hypothetical protein
MRILIACETHGRVRDAFIARGHDAVSCDLLPSKAGGPHIQGCALEAARSSPWDMMVAHPPCTYLSASGLHWNARPGYEWREAETEKAVEFVRALIAAPIRRKCIENPRGRIGTAIRRADQIIQPNQFGEDASKETHLWLWNLPKLRPTGFQPGRLVDDGRAQLGLFGTGVERWANQTDAGQNRLGPSPDRWDKRSATYHGIAAAMAEQWG